MRNDIILQNMTHDLSKIAKAYDSPPWWYDIRGFFILTFAYRSTLWEQVALFNRNMGQTHLEGAVGTGTLLGIVLKWRALTRAPVVDITGFDYAEPMLDGARRRFRKNKNVTLLHADVGALPFADAHFDTVNIANSVHCFPDVASAFAEVYRVLKPGGTFAMNVLLYPKSNSFLDRISNRINAWGAKKGILHRPYHQDEIRTLLKDAGFGVTYEHVRGNVFNVIAVKQ
jgi:ubiquinone/menaquinone biosynthesis C-methylase UbiE